MKSVELKKIFYFVILILFLVTSFFTIKYLFFNKKSSNSSSGFNITNQHLYSSSFLYLYPKKETKVTVSFDDFKKINRIYPLYKDKWIVTAKSNGDLINNFGNRGKRGVKSWVNLTVPLTETSVTGLEMEYSSLRERKWR